VKIGVIVPGAASDSEGGRPSWPAILSFARAAEAHGLDSVWVFDHFFHKPSSGPIDGQLEAWTVVSALAAATERVEIGTLVLCSSFRHPSTVAKMAATADEVSDGRLILGLGAGWHDAEYDAFGFPKDHRVDRFEEALGIIVPLLRGEKVTSDGEYFTTRDAVLEPPPSRHIPVLVAAFGRRMLRLTARRGRVEHGLVRRARRVSARPARCARRGARRGGPRPRDPRAHRRHRGPGSVARPGRRGR
jgi:alkanesulfonate monooxygenase SsuD/methylene tetrahydromethanopterin reductase-like flavin-dependent oxidoreductase (luciferase family)